ncbi:MAG: cardiolipin synthase [Spirochaeta sp.]|jgi:cardiolipin synthase|nr:cardiolipin synthase [Spirochaeta sp.]
MLLAIVIATAQVLGVLSSISALLTTRTSQGAIAWIVSLNTFPYLAVPAYWVFGRTRFNGYIRSRKEVDQRLISRLGNIGGHIALRRAGEHDEAGRALALERIAKLPFTRGNTVELLTNGRRAFDTMFGAIRRARSYCLIQFYIVRDDSLGEALRDILVDAVQRGVAVYFLYDEIGSHALGRGYVRDLRDHGVRMHPFSSTRGVRNRFQLNFRNHRKVLVVDGVEGFVGGFNVGNEYLGESPRFGPWRDTHLRMTGPALTGLQLPFVEDWHWATGEYLDLDWQSCAEHSEQGQAEYLQDEGGHAESDDSEDGVTVPMAPIDDAVALVLPSGPADATPTASLIVQHAIHSASNRLWIASPYFVPDEGVQDALKLAVLRGVDVRVLIPDKPDHLLIYLSAFAFVGHMLEAGVRIFRFLPGFLHQKAMLIDDSVATIGTVNIDNRSFRLNFEITAIVGSRRFAAQVESMLTRDFSHSREMTVEEMRTMPVWLRVVSRLAYLLAPIQ